MSRIILLMHLSSFLVAHLFISGVVSTTFTITNSCNYTVWPGVYSLATPAFSTTGFSLEKNESKILKAPDFWNGRFWGRTYCTEDSSGNFSCITGDCGSGKLQCSGRGGAPAATLAEFGLGISDGLDFYDVSLVYGFNLPLLVVPSDHQNCSSTGCIGDVNESCPTELEVTTGKGKRVGCKGVCDGLNSSIYSCDGTGSSTDPREPSQYSNFFKNLCPQSYSYVYDDTDTSFSCSSTDYQITFCPGKSINTTSYGANSRNTTGGTSNNSRPPTGEITPSSMPNPIRNTTGVTANNSRPPTGEITPSSMPEIRPNATSRRKWEPIVAGVVGGVLAIISFVVIVVLRVRWSKSEDTEEDEEDDHIQQVPGMPVREMSEVQLSMRGTPGYLAPEWHKSLGQVTIKVDVYSFGIVLLEVVCARRNVDHSQPESAFHLLRMLQEKAEYILGYLDEYIQSDREEIIRMLEVAAWCLQDDPERRPLMSTVVKVLEGLMEVDSNLVYKFSHALTPPSSVDAHISSAPPPQLLFFLILDDVVKFLLFSQEKKWSKLVIYLKGSSISTC
ncbi:hypothetical protein OIU79_020396 [Salix purpurea]|uniref:Protein kinase domain-containing protein n=1 Tax=Salix purpurea TaxID=77065 RepID=A0A9Q0WP67_SALPP|nr:hypothetical protein OIU79_020396 [Salix purpurea]